MGITYHQNISLKFERKNLNVDEEAFEHVYNELNPQVRHWTIDEIQDLIKAKPSERLDKLLALHKLFVNVKVEDRMAKLFQLYDVMLHMVNIKLWKLEQMNERTLSLHSIPEYSHASQDK